MAITLGRRGPKKGHGGRPRGSYQGPIKKDTKLRRAWRLVQRQYREQKYSEESRKRRQKK